MVIFKTWVTSPAITNLLVLAGLTCAVVVSWRLLWRGPRPPAWAGGYPRGRWAALAAFAAAWPFVVPQSLVALGFWLSHSTDTIWIIISVGAVALLSAFAVHILRRLALRTGVETSGPALAVVVVASSLLQLGALLLVRLVIVADPAEGFGAGLTGKAWRDVWDGLLVPMLVVAVVLLIARVVLAGRLPGAGRFVGRVAATGRGEHFSADNRRAATAPAFSESTTAWAIVGAAGVSLALFLLPLADRSEDGAAQLTFRTIATPEYGKIAFLFALAMLVARYGHRLDAARVVGLRADIARVLRRRPSPGELRGLWLRYRYVIYPVGLFAVVALASAIRKDFGTIVPALAATIGVTWSAGWHAAQGAGHAAGTASLGSGRRLRRAFRAYRVFIVVGLAASLMAIAVAARTDYIDERARVWSDPWAFRWEAGCLDPEHYPAGVPQVPGAPVLCQEALVANVESARSQVAQALAAIADGGAWGRGLFDTVSGRVPAGSTDFILAVVWNKLGGLTVLLGALLIVLLGAALRQVAAPPHGPPAVLPSPVALFAAGLAAMIVGQYLFVLAATLSVVPHSGIPAPFLSRGGHATLALLLGIMAVLLLAPGLGRRRSGHRRVPGRGQTPVPDDPWPAPAPDHPRIGWRGVLLPVGLCAALVANITVSPYQKGLPLLTGYDSNRPLCPSRASMGTLTKESLLSKGPNPALCSTDVIAFNRTRVEIRLPGGAVLRQQRPSMTWKLVGGDPHDSLVLEDLTGLVKVGRSGTGLLDQSYRDVVSGTIGSTLARRLTPNLAGLATAGEAADGALELTIDPGLQHVAATALRSDGPAGARPLAGGIVAIDATTGAILVSATAPSHLPPKDMEETARPVERTPEVQRFLDTHGSYANWTGGELEGTVRSEFCSRDDLNAGDPRSRDCWKWSTKDAPADAAKALADQLRYVGGRTDVPAPDAKVNRALGQRYGLGSTFKVVIAAAYLGGGGHAEDTIDAPDIVTLTPSLAIHNAGGGPCRGVVDGQISLRQALAVSCNTAFVKLAQKLGWPAIAAQARRFGLTAVACPPGERCACPQDAAPWLALPPAGATASCVPDTVDDVAIGNSALGGQDVLATPLGMATVMAAAANEGKAWQPTLVHSLTYPATGRTEQVVPEQVQALSPGAASELVHALDATAVSGTARGLQDSVGRPLWVKTGTHEHVPPEPGEFVRVNSWMVGFTKTSQGRPVSFAVVVEAGDEKAGSQRVRDLVRQLCAAIGEAA
jgi:cell division protein FtsI/penicillin-binding protein 2/cell division protein FtsW (lipid II flippase)